MLNQRSVVFRISSLPTRSTSTDGTIVRPSSAPTSFRRNRENGSPRRRSTASFTRLRASTNASASSIVASAIDSAYSTTSVRKSGLICVDRSASVIIAIRLTSRRTMPARMRRGLSRNGRRSGDAGAGGTRRGGRFGRPSNVRTVLTADVPEPRPPFSRNEGELRHAGHVVPVPGPEEEHGARSEERPHAQIVLGVGFETGRREERQAIEVRQPAADRVFVPRRVGALDPAVVRARDAVLAGERVVLHARGNRRRRDRPVEPYGGAAFQIDVVVEREGEAAVDRIRHLIGEPVG